MERALVHRVLDIAGSNNGLNFDVLELGWKAKLWDVASSEPGLFFSLGACAHCFAGCEDESRRLRLPHMHDTAADRLGFTERFELEEQPSSSWTGNPSSRLTSNFLVLGLSHRGMFERIYSRNVLEECLKGSIVEWLSSSIATASLSSLDVKRSKRWALQSSILCCEFNKCKLCKVLALGTLLWRKRGQAHLTKPNPIRLSKSVPQ